MTTFVLSPDALTGLAEVGDWRDDLEHEVVRDEIARGSLVGHLALDGDVLAFDLSLSEVLIPLVLRDVVLDLTDTAGRLTEFAIGQQLGVSYAPPGPEGYVFSTFPAEELSGAVAAVIASAPRTADAVDGFAARLAEALEVTPRDLPPADARFDLRAAFANGTGRAAIVTRHGTSFAWLEPVRGDLALVHSGEDLAALLAAFVTPMP